MLQIPSKKKKNLKSTTLTKMIEEPIKFCYFLICISLFVIIGDESTQSFESFFVAGVGQVGNE